MELKTKVGSPLKYVIKAFLIATLIYVIVSFFPVEKLTSESTTCILNFFGIDAKTYEMYGRIYLQDHYISIKCTSVRIIAGYLGLALSTKSPLTKKFIFSVIFSIIAFLLNNARLSIGYYLSEIGIPRILAHDLVWWGFFFAVGMLFFTISKYCLPQINKWMYIHLGKVSKFLRYVERK